MRGKGAEMKEGIILYQSKYGAAKKYAQWLKEETGFDWNETKKATIEEAEEYETIVLCGGIYASGIAGISFLRKNRQRLQGKKTAIFCVGASPYDEGALAAIRERNFPKEDQDVPLFYGRGIWDENEMTFMDRGLCKMLQKSLAKKDRSSYEPWMEALMASAGQRCDWTDRAYLEPLIAFLKR